MRAAIRCGVKGACLALVRQDSHSYLARSGASLALVARSMWGGGGKDLEALSKRLLEAQFEQGAELVELVCNGLEDWIDGSEAPEPWNDRNSGNLRFAHQVLTKEGYRDELEHWISGIEECPPCEPGIELAQSLATLVALYDLEECDDAHQSKALARTIWSNSKIESWPGWLRRVSPLAERLAPYL